MQALKGLLLIVASHLKQVSASSCGVDFNNLLFCPKICFDICGGEGDGAIWSVFVCIVIRHRRVFYTPPDPEIQSHLIQSVCSSILEMVYLCCAGEGDGTRARQEAGAGIQACSGVPEEHQLPHEEQEQQVCHQFYKYK